MCGIVGFFGYHNSGKKIEKGELLSLTNLQAHRGPDDWGCVLFDRVHQKYGYYRLLSDFLENPYGDVGLGHRRLSIIDLSEKGRQPMGTDDGKVWIVYNGEVYNYVELRTELADMGYRFDSTTDTEVVLKAYLAWGVDCFAKFNGMWALAIYDRHTEKMILSRDRFGKKPLYYFDNGQFILFASEIKALLPYHGVEKKLNLKKVADYAGRHYRYVDNDEESFFQGIRQVAKSSYTVIDAGGKMESNKYWGLSSLVASSKGISEGDLVDEFRHLLEDAVRIRLRSDVPVGCMLSGGLDSGSITALAAKQHDSFITFSGVTGTGYYDESEYIKEVVAQTGVNSHFIYPQASELLPTLKEMLAFHDEPVCTVTWYSNYVITREIAKYDVPVILTGHGGDELLAGYWDHYHYHFSDLRAGEKGDNEEHGYWERNHQRPPGEYESEKGYIERLHQDYNVEIQKYSRYLHCLAPEMQKCIVDPVFSYPSASHLSRRLYLELLYETIPPSLRAEDRNMMAFSIENRLPFLDYRLVEYCFGLNSSCKIREGLGKWLLREAMKGILPEKVRLRKDKAGFNAPADEWFRHENRSDIEAMINEDSFVNNEIYNHDELKKRFQEHLNGQNHYMFIWQYINLNLWYSQFFHS